MEKLQLIQLAKQDHKIIRKRKENLTPFIETMNDIFFDFINNISQIQSLKLKIFRFAVVFLS